jgi:PleD family two-component response regulator
LKIKGIMSQHGGTLTAESDGLGRGATFTMSLPMYERMVVSDKAEATQASESVEFGHHLSSMRFLVVDDSSFNRKFLTRLLENNGHEVVPAEDGVVALEKIRESIDTGCPFDTILLDYEVRAAVSTQSSECLRGAQGFSYTD